MKNRSEPEALDISSSSRAGRIATWLEEHKGSDIVEISMAGKGHYCDNMVLVTAGSMRHAQGLADGLVSYCHELGQDFLRMEGYNTAQWILLDLNDIIVHVFLEDSRRLYGLERLWGWQEIRNIIPGFQEALEQ